MSISSPPLPNVTAHHTALLKRYDYWSLTCLLVSDVVTDQSENIKVNPCYSKLAFIVVQNTSDLISLCVSGERVSGDLFNVFCDFTLMVL